MNLSLFIPRRSRAHRLFPLTKLYLVGLFLAGALALPGTWPAYGWLLLGILPLAVWSGVPRELGRTAAGVALPFAVSIFLVQGFFWPKGTPLVHLGPLSLKQEGLDFAIASTGRILVLASSFLWFAFTTRPDTLMMALVQRGFPASLAYMIVSTIQIVPRFRFRAAAILDAQRARGLETGGGLVQRARAVLPLVVPLVLSSLIDVEERALAIEARAFNHPGPKTSFTEVAEAGWEPAVRWGILLGAAGCILLGAWLRLRS